MTSYREEEKIFSQEEISMINEMLYRYAKENLGYTDEQLRDFSADEWLDLFDAIE